MQQKIGQYGNHGYYEILIFVCLRDILEIDEKSDVKHRTEETAPKQEAVRAKAIFLFHTKEFVLFLLQTTEKYSFDLRENRITYVNTLLGPC